MLIFRTSLLHGCNLRDTKILKSYDKFIKLQPFIIVFVDVLATAAAFAETTVHQV